jgi:hypothetical protein
MGHFVLYQVIITSVSIDNLKNIIYTETLDSEEEEKKTRENCHWSASTVRIIMDQENFPPDGTLAELFPSQKGNILLGYDMKYVYHARQKKDGTVA